MVFLLQYLLVGLNFFLQIITWVIIIDVILSWLTLLGIQIIIGPIVSIVDPIYTLTRKYFPTRIGQIDIAPLIIIVIINFLTMLVATASNSLIQ